MLTKQLIDRLIALTYEEGALNRQARIVAQQRINLLYELSQLNLSEEDIIHLENTKTAVKDYLPMYEDRHEHCNDTSLDTAVLAHKLTGEKDEERIYSFITDTNSRMSIDLDSGCISVSFRQPKNF